MYRISVYLNRQTFFIMVKNFKIELLTLKRIDRATVEKPQVGKVAQQKPVFPKLLHTYNASIYKINSFNRYFFYLSLEELSHPCEAELASWWGPIGLSSPGTTHFRASIDLLLIDIGLIL